MRGEPSRSGQVPPSALPSRSDRRQLVLAVEPCVRLTGNDTRRGVLVVAAGTGSVPCTPERARGW